MGANIIDYIASFVILLGLLTFTITSTTATLDNLYIYHSSQQLNSMAANLLNNLLDSSGSPTDWAQSTVDPTGIGFAWAIGEGNYVNPFVPMRLMDAKVERTYGLDVYNDLSSTTLGSWPGANIFLRTQDSINYDHASVLLNTNSSYGWRVTYTPAYEIEMATSTPSVIPWYAGWGYRMALTINHTKVPATIANYPILISLTQPTLDLNARSDGGDILFTSSDKLTKIPHEIDYFDYRTGKVSAWVKIPLLSSTADTVIYMYYGNPTVENQESPSSVWAGYASVYHMEDFPDSSHIADSSANGLTGVKTSDHEPAEIIDGVVSYAQNFDGSNDFISLSQATLTGGSEVFEMWLRSVKATTPQVILSSGFKNNTVGFIDVSRLPQTDTSAGNDLMIDYAANSVWVQKAGTLGIDLTCLVSFKNNLYGGTSDGQFYKWDGVSAWIAMTSLPSPEKFSSFAIFNNTLYAGTNGGGKLYEWDEGYSAWILRAPTLKIKSLILNPSDNQIYGGTDDGRLLRWNTGTSIWDVVASQLGSETSINSLAIYSSSIYAGTSPGGKLYKWDGVGSWALIATPPVNTPFTDVLSLGVHNGKLYAGTSTGGYLCSWITPQTTWTVEHTATGDTALTSILPIVVSAVNKFNYTSNTGAWLNGGNAVSSNNQYSSHSPILATNSPTQTIEGGFWSNPTGAYATGGTLAQTSTNAACQFYYGYGFSVTSTETISLVRVRLDAYRSSTGSGNSQIKLEVSADGGVTWLATTYTTAILGTSQTTYWAVITGWTSWTPAKVNQIQARVTHIGTGSRIVYLDWIPVEVTSVKTNSPSSIPGTVWTTPTGAYSSGGTLASTSGATGQIYSGYGLSIASTETISLVRVRLDAYRSSTGSGNNQIKLEVSADGGATWLATTYTTANLGTSQTTYWAVITSWTSWTPAKVNQIQARVTRVGTGSRVVYLDWLPVEVTHLSTLSPTDARNWISPINAYNLDGLFANTQTNGAQLYFYGFGYSVPSSDTIEKVRIRLDAYGSSVSQQIKVEVSADGGTSWLATTSTQTLTASLATYWVDITTWASWTPAMLNTNNIQTRVTFVQSGSATLNLDWVAVEVTYHDPPASQTFSSWNSVPYPLVTKVEVGLEAYTDGDEKLSVTLSWDGGSTWATSQLYTLPTSDPNSQTYLDFTSATAWTVDKLSNSNFKVKITDSYVGTQASSSYLDYIVIRVSSTVSELEASGSPSTSVWTLSSTNVWSSSTGYPGETSILSMALIGTKVFGCSAPNGYLLTRTAGVSNSWVKAADPPTTQKIISLLSDGTTLYGGTSPNGRLYKSTGSNWSPLVAAQYGEATDILALAFDSTGTRVEAGTNNVGLLLGVLRSSGSSWTKDAAITLATQTNIPSMAVYNGKLYLGTSPNGLLYEWDGVNSWVQRAAQYTSQTSINSLTVFKGKLYGGTSPGSLLEWTTGNTDWDQVAVPFGSETTINALASYNNKLYGATSPGGRLLEWNSISKVWVGKTYILGVETSISSLAVYNGKLYGGTSPSGLLYEWDGATKWVKMANSLNSQANIAALVVFNNRLYGATGSSGHLFECSDVGSRIYPGFFTGYENKWMHVTVLVDYVQKRIDFYQNGTLLSTSLTVTNIVKPTKTPKYLGAYVISGASYNGYFGRIDELRISETAKDPNWINLSFNNQRLPSSFTVNSPEESIFFKVKIKVTGKDGPIRDATCSGTLIYCIPGATTPSYAQLSSQTEITDINGEADVEFRGYTSDNPVYVVLMRAEHVGVSGVDYFVSTSSLTEEPLGVFVTDYTNGGLTIAHRKDFSELYIDNEPVGYNATFVMPIGTNSYSSVYLGSAGQISPGSPGYVQLGQTKESTGVLLVFYKTATNTYGVTYTPWGVSALGLEATIGAPIKDATNVITKSRVVNIGPFTYDVKLELWSIGR